jgi:hypothetical protein
MAQALTFTPFSIVAPILAMRERPMRVLIFIILVLFWTENANADIGISPLRQVLDADTREARFTVSNPTPRIMEGRARWVDLSATETGYIKAGVGARRQMSAAPWLTLSPAHFTLEPGARITVIVRAKDGVAPPPGERRSHLLIETAAPRTLLRKASDGGLQVDIGAGVSAPVILRGSGKASAKIENTRLLRDGDGLLLLATSIKPGGKHSSFGRLIATFEPQDDDEHLVIKRANVAGYTDAERRRVELPLGFFSLGSGELTLRYEGAEEYEGRLFDERRYDITPPE